MELETDLDDHDLELLLNHDDDPFNRWESAQRLYMRELLAGTADAKAGRAPEFSQGISDSFGKIIKEPMQDRAFQAQLLQLPNTGYVGEQLDEIDPLAVYRSHLGLRCHLATRHREALENLYAQCNRDSRGNPTASEICLLYTSPSPRDS